MSEFAEAPFAATPGDFELGRKALLEITPADTIGAPAGSIDEGDGVVSVYFDVAMLGYVGWRWTTSIAHVEGSEPTVLETEMTPGDGALLSPDWVPWADRLADYKETQAGLVADGDADAGDDDDDFDDDDVNDDDDALLHSGDLDGVDIDSLEDDDSVDSDGDDGDSDDGDDFDDSVPAAPVGVDEADEAEPEADDARPDPPAVTRGKQRGKKKQQDDQAE